MAGNGADESNGRILDHLPRVAYSDLRTTISQVSCVPHHAVGVDAGVQRSDHIPGLTRQEAEPTAVLATDVGVPHPDRLSRLAAAILEVEFDLGGDLGGAPAWNGVTFDLDTNAGQARMQVEFPIIGVLNRGVLRDDKKWELIIGCETGVGEDDIYARETV